MDDETRAAFARIDRWFELSQEQFTGLRQEVRAMSARVGETTSRLEALEREFASFRDEMRARLEALDRELVSVREETRERFISVDEQLHTGRTTLALLHERVVEIRDLTTRHGERLDRMEIGMAALNGRIDTLSDDIRQRFRAVNERLGSAA